ncbi:MAG: hypothetical protein JWP31_2639 [Aeromicrobium sp.]|nr:hypothetical protein [Aeromicrobium sp.]
MTRGSEPTVLRADFGAYARWFREPVRGIGLLLAVVGGGLASAIRGGDGAVLFFVIVGTLVVTLGSIAILIVTSRVTITTDRIEYRRWFVRTTLRLDDDLVGVLAEFIASPVGRTSQVLVLRARSGGRRIRLNGAYWDHEDLLRVAEAAGAIVADRAMTPREFEAVAPGSMPFSNLHPWIFGLGVAVPLIAMMIGAVFAWLDVRNIPPFDEQPPRAVSAATASEQDLLVGELRRAVGGEWDRPDTGFSECEDDDDYKGWSRRVSVRLRETLEDKVVTPVRPTQDTIDAINQVLRSGGLAASTAELDDLGRSENAYLEVRSIPPLDDRRSSTVSVVFSRGRNASISIYSACETPRR